MREPLLGVAIGKKGVGKSYTTNKLIEEYITGNLASGILPRKALILDVNDEYEHIKGIAIKDLIRFSVHPHVEARRIRPFHPDGKKMRLDDLATTLNLVLETFTGGLLLIEDINRFVSDMMPQDFALSGDRSYRPESVAKYQLASFSQNHRERSKTPKKIRRQI